MVKYLILDFGKVLAGPTTGQWFITPYFLKVIDINKLDLDKLAHALKEHNPILARKAETEEDEYNLFYEFYSYIFKEIDYSVDDSIIKDIAHDFTYQNSKYTLYDNVKEELEELSRQYTLLMLTDNWPCVIRILKEFNIYHYFDKVYVSSIYGCQKKDKYFFDYPINDYQIKSGEAIFIDDNEDLIDIAHSKGLDVRLMNREQKDIESKYEIITDLSPLIKSINSLKSNL